MTFCPKDALYLGTNVKHSNVLHFMMEGVVLVVATGTKISRCTRSKKIIGKHHHP